MLDPLAIGVGQLRPTILINAARMVAAGYFRDDHCPAKFRNPSAKVVIKKLAEAEAELEQARRSRAPGYSPTEHVRHLGAYIAEMSGRGKLTRPKGRSYRATDLEWGAR